MKAMRSKGRDHGGIWQRLRRRTAGVVTRCAVASAVVLLGACGGSPFTADAQQAGLADDAWMNLPAVSPSRSAREVGVTSLIEAQTRNITFALSVDRQGQAGSLTLVDADGALDRTVFLAQAFVLESQFPPATVEQGQSYRARTTVQIDPTNGPALDDQPAASPTVRIVVAVGEGRSGSGDGLQGGDLAGPTPIWEETFAFQDFSRVYPRRAYRRRQNGSAELSCVILDTRRLACDVMSETPAGWGFGQAALDLTEEMLAGPALRDGSPAPGFRFTAPFEFRAGR